MKNFILTASLVSAAVALIACSRGSENPDSGEADLSGVAVGQIRGATAISDTLRTRMLDDADPTTPRFAVERVAGTAIFGLRRQLGAIAVAGTQNEFQGGTPAPLNMTLWHQVFGRFGQSMADLCTTGGVQVTFSSYTTQGQFFPSVGDAGARGPGTFSLFPTVAARVTDACAFQGDEAARRTVAGALFDTVMGRGGSLADERAAFVTRFAADGSPFLAVAPKDRVSSMFIALLLNPHFILTK